MRTHEAGAFERWDALQELGRLSSPDAPTQLALKLGSSWGHRRLTPCLCMRARCAYNLLNGTDACNNDRLLNALVRDRFGFKGFVMSDWWALRTSRPGALLPPS